LPDGGGRLFLTTTGTFSRLASFSLGLAELPPKRFHQCFGVVVSTAPALTGAVCRRFPTVGVVASDLVDGLVAAARGAEFFGPDAAFSEPAFSALRHPNHGSADDAEAHVSPIATAAIRLFASVVRYERCIPCSALRAPQLVAGMPSIVRPLSSMTTSTWPKSAVVWRPGHPWMHSLEFAADVWCSTHRHRKRGRLVESFTTGTTRAGGNLGFARPDVSRRKLPVEMRRTSFAFVKLVGMAQSVVGIECRGGHHAQCHLTSRGSQSAPGALRSRHLPFLPSVVAGLSISSSKTPSGRIAVTRSRSPTRSPTVTTASPTIAPIPLDV
jgi:hypothetical protein